MIPILQKLTNLSTKKLVIIFLFILPLINILNALTLSFTNFNFDSIKYTPVISEFSFFTPVMFFIYATLEEIIFRYDSNSDEKTTKTYTNYYLFLIFCVFTRVLTPIKEYYEIIGLFITFLMLFILTIRLMDIPKPNPNKIKIDSNIIISSLSFSLVHLVQYNSNSFNNGIFSFISSLLFIIPFLITAFISGIILMIIRNRYSGGLMYTIILHTSYNLLLSLPLLLK